MVSAAVTVDADGLRFLGHVLEAYFAWRSNTHHLGFVCFANYMRIPQPIENRRVLNLSDDQFVRVDQAFAHCDHQAIIVCEYTHTGKVTQKARQMGIEGANYSAVVGQYRAWVRLAELQMYMLLTPDLQEWQDKRMEEGKLI